MMRTDMTEDELMNVDCTFEKYRKAMIRAGRNQKVILETAGSSMFILERIHNDNLINRWIGTPIGVSQDMDNLVQFCKKLYGQDAVFADTGQSNVIETDIGQAYFTIKEIALVK